MILYSFNVSPYCKKVRAILQYKGLPFEERWVHPLKRRALRKLSGQEGVPVLDDDGHVIVDSTAIAQHLDARHPERPVVPREPGPRGRALLAEDWADEALARAVQPVRWVLPANAKRTIAEFRTSMPPGRADDLAFAAVARVVALDERRKYGTRTGSLPPSEILRRLAQAMDVLDAALAETGYIAGAGPTVGDFAAWGFVSLLDGLDGWEIVKARKHVLAWHKQMSRGAPVVELPRRLPLA